VPFGAEIRKRILGEIFSVLDDIKKTSDSHIAQHKIVCQSYLLVYLLQIKTVAHISFKNIHDPAHYNFIKLYMEIFKHFNLKGYYNNEKTLSFVTEVLAVLYNLGINLVVRKRLRFNDHIVDPDSNKKYLSFCIG
jgi:hypothetical protein